MPHLVILYSGNLDQASMPGNDFGVDMSALCKALADCMCKQVDETGKAVFPIGGIRVFAYPAPHFAIADGGAKARSLGGTGEYGFAYLNVRMAKGRSSETHRLVGDGLVAVAKQFFAHALATQHVGVTVQVDEGIEVFDAKNNSLHPLFAKPNA